MRSTFGRMHKTIRKICNFVTITDTNIMFFDFFFHFFTRIRNNDMGSTGWIQYRINIKLSIKKAKNQKNGS